MNAQFIAIYGDPVEGFAFVGPFSTHEEAISYAAIDAPCNWWVSRLDAPDNENFIEGA